MTAYHSMGPSTVCPVQNSPLDLFNYLPESPIPPPSPNLKPSSFHSHLTAGSQLPRTKSPAVGPYPLPEIHPPQSTVAHKQSHNRHHAHGEDIYMSTSSIGSHKSSLSSRDHHHQQYHQHNHSGAGESQAVQQQELLNSSGGSLGSHGSSQQSAPASPSLLIFSLGSQQVKVYSKGHSY
jgi:hypothetical protein